MIKKLYVDNFKALNEFEIQFESFTVIVGNNTSGKSTILQVIDFMSSIVREDFNVVLERRGWNVADIKSKMFPNKPRMTFKMDIDLPVAGEMIPIRWEIVIHAYSKKDVMEMVSEKVYCLKNQEIFLAYGNAEGNYLVDDHREITSIGAISDMHSSFLKMIAVSNENRKQYSVLVALKEFLVESDSFELLSPEKMRLSSRGNVETIGNSGEKLPSFIKSMNERQKIDFHEKLKRLFKNRIITVSAKTNGKPGWTQMIAEEKYDKYSIQVGSKNMSDGMLRMLALLAISEIDKKNVVMLLDEIENGINLDYAETLIEILEEVCETKGNQLIVTTHSTVFIDYVKKNSIIYLFRDPRNGFVRSISMGDSPIFEEKLEYLYPGEVFMNMSNEELIKALLEDKRED